MSAAPKPVISIVVASHRSVWIEELCVNLLNQHGDETSREIIFVTDYNNDIFRNKFPGILWLYVPDKSISVKRNHGINSAHGEIIAFTDDDCIPSPDWVKSGVEYLTLHGDTDCVEGFTTIEKTDAASRMHQEYSRLEQPGFRTNNIFYRHQVLVEAGSFDDRFSVQREDMDLAFTVLSKGKKIDYGKEIRVTHRFRTKERWDLLKNCWNRRFDPLLFSKHPALYRLYIRSPFPKSLLVVLFVWIALLFVALAGLRIVFLYIGIVLIVCTLIGAKRTGVARMSIKNVVSEMVSLLLAPIVLIAALIHGSLKFKKLLII